MSDLLKKALKKGPPPKQEDEMNEEDEDDYEYDEEDKQQMELMEEKNNFQDKFPGVSTGGPIKPTQKFDIPKPQSKAVKGGQKTKLHDYTPDSWKNYYDSMEFMENGTPVYKKGDVGPIFFCLHGTGDSASSFACLANEVCQFSSLVSFDFRGHGESKIQENKEDLSVETLVKDSIEVLEFVAKKYPDPTIIIAGHSMGGAIATKFAVEAMKTDIAPRIQGLIVIDVVEGTAMDALPFMSQVVSQRPKMFETQESLIQWSIRASQLRNLQSARVSMPAKVREVEIEGKKLYEWKVDLMKTEKHWVSWYKGLTNAFLEVKVPKLLMTAEKERMDKDLTIAQMQGRFKLSVLYNTGHYMQEDDFPGTAGQFHGFLQSFRIPGSIQDQQKLKEMGVGKFTPTVLPYKVHHGLKK